MIRRAGDGDHEGAARRRARRCPARREPLADRTAERRAGETTSSTGTLRLAKKRRSDLPTTSGSAAGARSDAGSRRARKVKGGWKLPGDATVYPHNPLLPPDKVNPVP